MELPDWLRAFGIVGETPTGYALVRLTEDGDLYAYLVGDYEGTVVPVTLDSEGRLSAFVVDSRDVWEQIVKVGNAELAARLGGLPRYHRAGQVHFSESFDNGMERWDTQLLGTGAAAALAHTYTSTGPYSVKLTGGSDGGREATLTFERGILPRGRTGLSVGFSLAGTIDSIEFVLRYYDGIDAHITGIRFDDVDDDLDCLDDALAWDKIDDINPANRNALVFNYVKLLVDFDLDKYATVWFNDLEFDVSDQDVYTDASPLAPHFNIDVTLMSRAANNDVAYIDDIVLTAAEP